MNVKKKIAAARTVYMSLMVIVTSFLIVTGMILKTDSSYPAGLARQERSMSDIPSEPATTIAEPDFSYESIRLTFAGSIRAGSMLGSDSYGTLNQLCESEGADYFLSGLSQITQNDDLTFAFVNSVFTDSDEAEPAERRDDEAKEWYKAPASVVDILRFGGIDALSLECSGTKDYGKTGYDDTKSAIDDLGLMWGDSGKAIYKTTSGGYRIGIYPCAYKAENQSGIISWIENARQKCDFVAVCVSGGDDGFSLSEEKKTMFRSFIDAGADLVVGTENSACRESEAYGGGFIVYSLGSLIDGADRYASRYTALLDVELKVGDNGIFETEYTIIPVCTYSETEPWKPYVIDKASEQSEYDKVMEIFTPPVNYKASEAAAE